MVIINYLLVLARILNLQLIRCGVLLSDCRF